MNSKGQIEERIAFLQDQLSALDHYLPETYQVIMGELDKNMRMLVTLGIKELYEKQSNEPQDKTSAEGNPEQDQESCYRQQGVRG
jgi:hypothetical protein